MLLALLAMREMAQARIAAVFAGIACGFALATAGLDAVWLPLLALTWLRVNQGLGWRSAGVVLGTTILVACTTLTVGLARVRPRARGFPGCPDPACRSRYLDAMLLRPAPAARELFPLLPLVLLGLWSMRGAWWQSESFRFVLLWLVLSAGSWARGRVARRRIHRDPPARGRDRPARARARAHPGQPAGLRRRAGSRRGAVADVGDAVREPDDRSLGDPRGRAASSAG